MSAASCCPLQPPAVDPGLRRALWIALVVNAAMFLTEVTASGSSGSVALLADAVDFLGDAATYGVSLAVLSMAAPVRSRAAVLKAAGMAAFGVFVLLRAAWAWRAGAPPEPLTMGAVALVALAANLGVTVLLFRHRGGDANLRSVWLCSRNDTVDNVAVGLAALGVFGTGAAWPDLVVATLMATLALTAAAGVLRQARQELHTGPAG